MITETQIELHNAHKERMQRIAMAAQRHKQKDLASVESKLVAKLEAIEARKSAESDDFWFQVDDTAGPDSFTIRQVQQATCRHFGVDVPHLRKKRRSLSVTKPRQIAMYLCREYTPRSLPEIGRLFGGYDHTTVLHAARRIADLIKSDWLIAYDVAAIEKDLVR